MKLYLDASQSPLSCLTVSDQSQTLKPMQTIFFGDKLPLEIVIHDGQGGQPPWVQDAEIKVGFGELREQNAFLESTCTRSGNVFSTSLDFSTIDFDTATASKETEPISFEVQASFPTGKTETICQQPVNLNNQILNQQVVTLSLPTRPSQVDVAEVPSPAQPQSVTIDIAPNQPSSVEATAVLDVAPIQPSLVIVNIRPNAPTGVQVGIVPYPPSSVTPYAKPLPPTSVQALTKPNAPTGVTVGRFPLAPISIYIEPDMGTPTTLWHPWCVQDYLVFWLDGQDEGMIAFDSSSNIERAIDKSPNFLKMETTDPAKRFSYDEFDNCLISESGEQLEFPNPSNSHINRHLRRINFLQSPPPNTHPWADPALNPWRITGKAGGYLQVESGLAAGQVLHSDSTDAGGTLFEYVAAETFDFFAVAEGHGKLVTHGVVGTNNYSRLMLGNNTVNNYAFIDVVAPNGSNTKYIETFNLGGYTTNGRHLIHFQINNTTSQSYLKIDGRQRHTQAIQNNLSGTTKDFKVGRIGDDWEGKICEIMILCDLPTNEIETMEGYLANRWQIQNQLP